MLETQKRAMALSNTVRGQMDGDDFYRAIYRLAFEEYDGFNNF